MKCLGQDLAHTPCTRRAHAVHTPCTRNARYVERVANRVVQRTVRTTRSYLDIFPTRGAMGRAIEDVFGYLAVVGVFVATAGHEGHYNRVPFSISCFIASIYVTSILWAGTDRGGLHRRSPLQPSRNSRSSSFSLRTTRISCNVARRGIAVTRNPQRLTIRRISLKSPVVRI